MNFTDPTTKQEMYDTLSDIYSHYRLQRESFSPESLFPISLERITFTPLTEAQLGVRSTVLLAPSQTKRKNERLAKLQTEYRKLYTEIEKLSEKRQNAISQIAEDYDNAIEKITSESVKKGMELSSVVEEKITSLSTEKSFKINEKCIEYDELLSALEAEYQAVGSSISDIDDYFETEFDNEVSAKMIELKDAQDKYMVEITKFNASQDEKEQRYLNSIRQINANLQLRFMEIKENNLTKEQLVEMGYYEDVIRCITAYYDTMPSAIAYQDINSESKLIVYLDDYYDSVLYMYRCRANM